MSAGYSKFLMGQYLEKITISYMVLFLLLFLTHPTAAVTALEFKSQLLKSSMKRL